MENPIVLFGFLGCLLFFFPVFTQGTLFYREGKLAFVVTAFEKIKVLGGYAELDKRGVVLHLSQKKAIFLPFDKMQEEKKKMDWKQGFQLYEFYLLVEADGKSAATLPLAVTGQTAIRYAFDRIRGRHPFIKLRSDLILSEEKLSVCSRFVVISNAFTISRAAVKIITGRIITAIWKKRKRTMKI